MKSICDDWVDFDDGRKRIKLFIGEFPGHENEEIKGSILKKEEPYYTLNHIGIDLSCIISKKRGKRISVNLEVYFNTRVSGKFHNEVSIGWGQAYYFPKDCEIYIEDLNIRQTGSGGIMFVIIEKWLLDKFGDKSSSVGRLQTFIRSWSDFLLCACSPAMSEAPKLSKSRYGEGETHLNSTNNTQARHQS